MKVKTKDKTVRTFTLKLSVKELKSIYYALVDIDTDTCLNPGLEDLYDALRAEVHRL